MATNAVPKMQYVRLGNTGTVVSKVCLGGMGFGFPEWTPWVLGEKESLEIIKSAYDAGINFFDTAHGYSNGESERILGKAIKQFGFQRSKIVIATKIFYPFVDGDKDMVILTNNQDIYDRGLVNQHGLSRKYIFDSIDESLKRLQVDYIDLYQIHKFDPDTPIEETMEALNDLVRMGKVRHIGASTLHAWQLQKMNYVAEKNGWTKFVTMQNFYNLLYREEEREMAAYCLDAKIGWIPWSPLAGGFLTRPMTDETVRSNSVFGYMMKSTFNEVDPLIVNRVLEVAKKYNATPAQIALAWCWTKPYVSSPIVGISKKKHLDDLLSALNISLAKEDCDYLEELYVPKKPYGLT